MNEVKPFSNSFVDKSPEIFIYLMINKCQLECATMFEEPLKMTFSVNNSFSHQLSQTLPLNYFPSAFSCDCLLNIMALKLNYNGKVNEKYENNATRQVELNFVPKFRWIEVLIQTFVHVGSFVGLYYFAALKVKLLTCLWCNFKRTRHVQHEISNISSQFLF